MTIALYHFHVTQIKRSAGQSAIASAAYRSGKKLHSERISYDLVGFIPLNELMKEETA